MQRSRDFGEVKDRAEAAARRLGTSLREIGNVDGYPILGLSFGAGIPVWIDAGIHGEEPGSVAGILSFLDGPAASFADRMAFDVYPCLNPFGYERHFRLNARGDDPNRQLKNPADPLRRVLDREAGEKWYELSLDLHEDSDFYGAYIYDRLNDGPSFAPAMRDAMASVGPVAARSETPPTRDGLVRFDDGRRVEDARAEMMSWEMWPIAGWLFGLHSSRQFTVETPGHQTIGLRAAMQVAAVVTALNMLLGEQS